MSAVVTNFAGDGQMRTVSYLSYQYHWVPCIPPLCPTSPAGWNFWGQKYKAQGDMLIKSPTRSTASLGNRHERTLSPLRLKREPKTRSRSPPSRQLNDSITCPPMGSVRSEETIASFSRRSPAPAKLPAAGGGGGESGQGTSGGGGERGGGGAGGGGDGGGGGRSCYGGEFSRDCQTRTDRDFTSVSSVHEQLRQTLNMAQPLLNEAGGHCEADSNDGDSNDDGLPSPNMFITLDPRLSLPPPQSLFSSQSTRYNSRPLSQNGVNLPLIEEDVPKVPPSPVKLGFTQTRVNSKYIATLPVTGQQVQMFDSFERSRPNSRARAPGINIILTPFTPVSSSSRPVSRAMLKSDSLSVEEEKGGKSKSLGKEKYFGQSIEPERAFSWQKDSHLNLKEPSPGSHRAFRDHPPAKPKYFDTWNNADPTKEEIISTALVSSDSLRLLVRSNLEGGGRREGIYTPLAGVRYTPSTSGNGNSNKFRFSVEKKTDSFVKSTIEMAPKNGSIVPPPTPWPSASSPAGSPATSPTAAQSSTTIWRKHILAYEKSLWASAMEYEGTLIRGRGFIKRSKPPSSPGKLSREGAEKKTMDERTSSALYGAGGIDAWSSY